MSDVEPPVAKLRDLFLAWLRQLKSPVVDSYLSELPDHLPSRVLQENQLPGLCHLADDFPPIDKNANDLIHHLIAVKHQLCWGQTYTANDFGQHYVDNYGWMELFGRRGHLKSSQMSGGFLLLGPGLHYPEHRHEAEEIYGVLAGDATWQRDGGEFVQHPPGTITHHPSNTLHSTKAGKAPMLALYLWRGGELHQKPEFPGLNYD